MEKGKQNWFEMILGLNKPMKSIKKIKTTSINNLNIARAFLIFTILLFSITFVVAANVTMQTGNLNVGANLTVAGVIRGQSVAVSGDVLLVGNDAKIVDIDIANTLGIYSQGTPTEGGIKLGSSGPTIYGKSSNVGIGTTSPDVKLDIRSSGTANAAIFNNRDIAALQGTYAGFLVHSVSTDAVAGDLFGYGLATYNSANNSQFYKASMMIDNYNDGGALFFKLGTYANSHSNTERMRITQAGKVGIGTATPTQALHVVGNANITGNVSSNGRNLDTYVVRNPSNWDFTLFTTNGSWINDGLDLSSIVPAGAKAVHLRTQIRDDVAGSTFSVRQSATNAYNQFSMLATGNYVYSSGEIIAIDSDRKLDYQASNVVWEAMSIVVLGWWV